jgi:flagella basal body P-ring formation protein FlgA
MRCSRKSTTWRGSAALVSALLALPALAGAQEPQRRDQVSAAIVEAVRVRVAGPVDVAVNALSFSLASGLDPIVARPEPGARPARFALLAGGQQRGFAVATLQLRLRHLRASQRIGAGDEMTAAVVYETVGDPGRIALERLPDLAELAHATATRALAAGEVITTRTVRLAPAVRSGESVTVRSVTGGVEVRAVATALQSGRIGDVIRLVNPDSRRQLRGRVVARSEVEVSDE